MFLGCVTDFLCVCVCTRYSGESLTPESQSGLSAQGSDSSVDADGDVESSTAEADQDIMSDENG